MGQRRVRALAVLTTLGAVLFLVGAAILALNYRVYRVSSPSMANTLRVGDRMVAERSAAGGADVRRGDIVLLRPDAFGSAAAGADDLVKRVIGVGGDTVTCCDAQHRVTVDGRALSEDYLYPGSPANESPFSVTVPRGRLFVLGDHRAVSQDSRVHLNNGQHGTVATSAVSARVVAVAWPLARLGEIPSTATFSALGPTRGDDWRYRIAGDGMLVGLVLLALAAVIAGVTQLRSR
ncbi:MAG: signal peptidase I [Sciscionella sp.]|nr:signal peptidase I [Sciscionella sp.]